MDFKDIGFTYEESENQENLFTDGHTKFDVTLSYQDREPLTATYQCNLRHVEPNAKDVLECLMLDMSSYEGVEDLAEFLYEFGYTDSDDSLLRKGIEAYEGCKEISEKLHKLFTDEELSEISEALENDSFDYPDEEERD